MNIIELKRALVKLRLGGIAAVLETHGCIRHRPNP